MLLTLPDGSHRNVPDPQRLVQDIGSLMQPRLAGRSDGPLEGHNYVEVDLNGGLYYFRYNVHDGRGIFTQDGSFEENYADFSDGDLIYDKPGAGRASFLPSLGTGMPSPIAPFSGRLQGGQFLGSGIVTTMDGNANDRFYKYADAHDPVFSLVTGFTRPAGSTYILSSAPVQINGAPDYAIGWGGSAVNSLQIISNLNNPPTSSTIPVGSGPVWGLTQTPIDDNALVIYYQDATGGVLYRIGMIPALGATAIEVCKRIPAGGYSVGMVNLDGTADLFFVVPRNGNPFYGGFQWSEQWQLLRTDQRCSYGPEAVDLKLPNVVHATGMGNAMAYCDGSRHHRWMTHASDIPIPGSDRPPALTGSIRVYCGGHHRYGEKFFWWEEEVDQSNVYPTQIRGFEYDSRLNRAWPITPRINGQATGHVIMGGPDMPVSPLGNLILLTTTGWRWQFQPATGTMGIELMHVDDAGATSGREFNDTSYRTTPRLRSRNHPNARFVGARLTGPTLSQLRRGTTYKASEALTPSQCRVEVSCNLFPELIRWTATEAEASEDYRPVYPLPASDDWKPYVQLTYWVYRGLSGTYAARYTPVVDHLTVEGYFYDPAPPPPSNNHENWGRNIEPPGNMTESLL